MSMFDPKTKILVIDDMLTMRKVVAKSLKEIGFSDITEAADGLQGWEQINGGAYGLIVSDWNMPNCTGLELLKKVRADNRFAKLPFVLLTAEGEAAQVMEALKSGASNYVLKPFTTALLRQKLEETWKKTSAA